MGSKFTTNVYVVRVVDGDSLWCVDGNSPDIEFEVRLFGVDAPELDQPYGTEAREHLEVLALGKNFWLAVKDVDHYDRVVGVLSRQTDERPCIAGWSRSALLSGTVTTATSMAHWIPKQAQGRMGLESGIRTAAGFALGIGVGARGRSQVKLWQGASKLLSA